MSVFYQVNYAFYGEDDEGIVTLKQLDKVDEIKDDDDLLMYELSLDDHLNNNTIDMVAKASNHQNVIRINLNGYDTGFVLFELTKTLRLYNILKHNYISIDITLESFVGGSKAFLLFASNSVNVYENAAACFCIKDDIDVKIKKLFLDNFRDYFTEQEIQTILDGGSVILNAQELEAKGLKVIKLGSNLIESTNINDYKGWGEYRHNITDDFDPEDWGEPDDYVFEEEDADTRI